MLIWSFLNFGFSFFIIAWIVIFFNYKFTTLPFSEVCFRWIAFFNIGIVGILNFILHGFYGQFTAMVIGWSNSPFQFEVATANLGFGILGLCAFNASMGFRKAMVLANACWLWGDAAGHIYQMITKHNFSAGNAGSWFWMDVALPLILWICLAKMLKQKQ